MGEGLEASGEELPTECLPVDGPAATIGEVLRVDLPRPRRRVEMVEDRHYVQYRKEVIDFLYTRHSHVEAAA
jgi:nitrate/nitrite transport system ATP-binding protein